MNFRALAAIVTLAAACTACQRVDRATEAAPPEATVSVIDALKHAASGGDASAQFDLAKRFDTGDGIPENKSAAMEWFLKAADAGNSSAMSEVAERYDNGVGVKQNRDLGLVWWQKAAATGQVSKAYYAIAKRHGAFVSGRSIALNVSPNSDFATNANKYVEALEKAAALGHDAAKFELGMARLLGVTNFAEDKKAVPPEPERGLALLKEAAGAKYWHAEWALAVLYQVGFGPFKQNVEESNRYWALLETHDDAETERRIANIYDESTRNYYRDGKNKYQGRQLTFEQTNQVAMAWYLKAAEKNEKFALYSVALMYRDGRGTFQDQAKAIEYFTRAANAKHFAAMSELGFAHLEGKGVVRDYAEAYRWLSRAADEDTDSSWSDVHRARNALGVLHEMGSGASKDLVLAYAWYNLAAAGGYDKAKQNLARVEPKLKPEEVSEGQTLSREWRPGSAMARASAPSAAQGTKAAGSTSVSGVGSGFYISSEGKVLTNWHVVEDCKEIKVPAEQAIGKVIVADQANDLALVKLDVSGRPFATFGGAEVKQGDDAYVFGFPLDGYLPATGNITPGIVSALAGPANNSSLIQVTAPVQPGNSGGPLLSKTGKVIGVIVGKADAIKIAKVTGDIPQNINFAIAPGTIRAFLDGNRVEHGRRGDVLSMKKSAAEIAEEARNFSVKIECWR